MHIRLYGAVLLFMEVATAAPGVGVQTPAAGLAAVSTQEGPTEADLEAEFKRNRGTIRASPEFKGTGAETHVLLGNMLHHRGDLTGATEEYRTAIKLEPELAEAYRGLGIVLMDRHDWGGAVEALRVTTRLRNDDAEAFYWLGRALMAQRDWAGATAALQQAIHLKPDDAEAYADLGLVYMAQGRTTEAAESLRHAVRLKPDHADTHRLLETVVTYQHDPQQVIRTARQILDSLFARE
jgi:cytochrome c-type biogenesis protein CcmH/NrfG